MLRAPVRAGAAVFSRSLPGVETMLSGAWCLYERRSQRWLFGRRKRLISAPSILIAVTMLFAGAWLGLI